MALFDQYLTQTFPGIRITSGKRDPNSRLGRANPRSYHNAGMAWDVAPVEGMSYDDFVNRVRGDGWKVLESRDEVNNPSRFATGPHWHIATDGRKEPQPMATGRLADIMAGIAPIAQQEAQQPTGLAGILQGAPNSIAPGGVSLDIPQVKVKGPGAFSKGGKGWQILGIIGDALQTAGGGRGTYMPYVAEQQERGDKIRQKLQELILARQQKGEDRAAALEDWQIKQQWERDNPGMTNAARMAQEAGYQPGTPQFQAAVRQYMQRPIMIGGEAYGYGAPQQQSGGLPPGYNPDEWEVVE